MEAAVVKAEAKACTPKKGDTFTLVWRWANKSLKGVHRCGVDTLPCASLQAATITSTTTATNYGAGCPKCDHSSIRCALTEAGWYEYGSSILDTAAMVTALMTSGYN